jgi:hypothetical protein
MKKNFLKLLMVVLATMLMTSCGKVPQAKIDSVNAAIEAATVAEAPTYLPVEFAAVQDSMKAIDATIEVQKSKLFKKFGPVNVKLDSTLEIVNRLAINAVVKKAEVKAKVESLLTETKSILGEDNALIKKAPRGKEGAVVLESIKSDIATIEATIIETETLFANGTFMNALDKITVANTKAISIKNELSEAIAKVNGK